MPDLDALAAEFGLGRLTGADPVPGHPHVVIITTLATMRHIAAYHAALRPVPFPAAQPILWTRVAEPGYLLAELSAPANADRPGPL